MNQASNVLLAVRGQPIPPGNSSRGRIWAEEIKPMATAHCQTEGGTPHTILLEWGNEWHRPFGKTSRPRQPSKSQKNLGDKGKSRKAGR